MGTVKRVAGGRAAAVLVATGLLAAALLAALMAPSALGLTGHMGGPAAHGAALADYGDAPDGARAGYLTAPHVIGHFPTSAGSNGAHHTDATGALRLGGQFDVESDSKQVNRDADDDGFFANLTACRPSTLTFVVNTNGLPAAMRNSGHTAYLNALFDWNRDGRWQGFSRCGGQRVPEWLVQNHPVDMAQFAQQTILAIQVTMPAGVQVKELWMRATLTLDQKMKSPGRGAFTYGETEDYFYAGGGPNPPLKGKKKAKAKKKQPDELLVDCLPAFLLHGTAALVPIFFSNPSTGEPVLPAFGTISINIANAGALPADVDAKGSPFGSGYFVTSKLHDERLNPLEMIHLLVDVSAPTSGPELGPGPWSFGLGTGHAVILACPVLIFHDGPTLGPFGGPPGGGPPGGGPGSPGGPGGGPTTPVDQAPTASFTFSPNNPPTTPKPGTVVSFDGTGSSDPDGTVVTWSWRVGAPLFGGGGTVSTSGTDTAKPAISFPGPGVYPVTLTVTDNGGKTASVTQNVFVSGPGSKQGIFSTDPTDQLGCSGSIQAEDDIYVPTYAQIPTLSSAVTQGTATGGCANATIHVTSITRTFSDAPPDDMGHARLDEWGKVKDTIHIKFTISGGSTAQGTVPYSVAWQ